MQMLVWCLGHHVNQDCVQTPRQRFEASVPAAAVYLHHLPQLLAQVGLEVGALESQGYHVVASIAVSLRVSFD